MQQLSGLDSAFLTMETRAVQGHVGSVCVIDPSTAPEPLTLERFTWLIESRLPLVPPFRRRLVEVPLGLDFPYWIEDPDFDIEFHVRELALPAPGNARQLKDQVARIHARPLDKSRPLWEIYLIWGLEGGRAAIYTKVHHSAIDGVSGNDILAAVLDLSPEGRDLSDPLPLSAELPPNPLALLARSSLALARDPLRAARLSTELLRAAPMLVGATAPRLPVVNRLVHRGTDPILSRPGLRAPHTPFNAPITQHRRWTFCDVPLDEIKAVKNAHGVTVNDVVLALATAALRRWLLDHEALPAGPLVAAVPVSVLTEADKGSLGNRVSAMLAALPTHLADPLDRLRAVHDDPRGEGAAWGQYRRTCSPTSRSSPCRRSPARPRGSQPGCAWSS